jgi:hypothetical protein
LAICDHIAQRLCEYCHKNRLAALAAPAARAWAGARFAGAAAACTLCLDVPNPPAPKVPALLKENYAPDLAHWLRFRYYNL